MCARYHLPIQLGRSISTPRRRDAGVCQEGRKELRPLPTGRSRGADDSWPGQRPGQRPRRRLGQQPGRRPGRWQGQGPGRRPNRHQPGEGARCIYAMASTARTRWRGEDATSSDQCGGHTCLGPRAKDLRDLCADQERKRINRDASERTTRPLQRFYTDFWGPFGVPTPSGARYILTFTDDYTRRSWIYLIRTHTEPKRAGLTAISEDQSIWVDKRRNLILALYVDDIVLFARETLRGFSVIGVPHGTHELGTVW